MGRNDSQSLNMIRSLCMVEGQSEKELYSRSRMVLSVYRNACWTATERAEETRNRLMDTCGSKLDNALIYLETFAPDSDKEKFEAEIHSLFETRWLLELTEKTMQRVRDYPFEGDLYCRILNLCYLGRFRYTEAEILNMLGMERSRFYDRKKEAILLFGIALWGSAIPGLKNSADQYCRIPVIATVQC